MKNPFKPCIVIPAYNPKHLLKEVLNKLEKYQLFIFIIDDGSTDKIQIESIKNIKLYHLEKNGGKGSAVSYGLQRAFENGFTHALQIDADNQHCTEDIPKFLKLAENNPFALINGLPIHNETIPKARMYGRKFTNLWVNIETLSFEIKDALCGFRVYPLEKTIKLINKTKLSQRMGFDIEILVRLYWAGIKIINQETKVNYPQDGISHFRMFKDNLEITKVHTSLFFEMFTKIDFLKNKFKQILYKY